MILALLDPPAGEPEDKAGLLQGTIVLLVATAATAIALGAFVHALVLAFELGWGLL